MGLALTQILRASNQETPKQSKKQPRESEGDSSKSAQVGGEIKPSYPPNNGWHPEEKQHRGREWWYWRGSLFWVRVTALLGAVTTGGAITAAVYAALAYHQAKRQADAAEDANRPWVDMTPANSVLKAGSPFQIRVNWSNAGHAPAFDVRTWVKLQTVNKGEPDPAIVTTIPANTSYAKSEGILVPGPTHYSDIIITVGNEAPTTSWVPDQRSVDQINSGRVALWLIGVVDYNDPSGGMHYLRGTGVYDPMIGAFVWGSSEAD